MFVTNAMEIRFDQMEVQLRVAFVGLLALRSGHYAHVVLRTSDRMSRRAIDLTVRYLVIWCWYSEVLVLMSSFFCCSFQLVIVLMVSCYPIWYIRISCDVFSNASVDGSVTVWFVLFDKQFALFRVWKVCNTVHCVQPSDQTNQRLLILTLLIVFDASVTTNINSALLFYSCEFVKKYLNILNYYKIMFCHYLFMTQYLIKLYYT